MMDDGEPAAQVVEAARAHGYVVTDDQRVRWHRAGLLPRPVQRHLGRGHGTEAVYPAGTAAQLVALLRLHDGKRLRVGHAGWALWWEGWPVAMAFARDALREAAREWEQAVTQLRNEGGDGGLSEAAWRAIEGRTDTPALRRALKRVGSKRSSTFKYLLVTIAAGQFEGFLPEADDAGNSDRSVFMHGMGLEKARKQTVMGIEPWLRSSLAEQLHAFQEAISPVALREALNVATDDDLILARDEWRAFLIGLDSARAVAEYIFGAGALGLAAAPRLVELDDQLQAMFLLAWLSLRRLPAAQEGIPQLLVALQPFATFRAALAV